MLLNRKCGRMRACNACNLASVRAGDSALPRVTIPVYAINTATRSDGGLLRALAERSGGRYVDATLLGSAGAASLLLADVYVDDAFGAAHRAHASVAALPSLLPSAAGRLLEREVHVLSRLRDDPVRPYVAVLGGAKVSDKLATLGALAQRVDVLCIGGAMAFTPIAARGGRIGASLVEPERGAAVLAVLEDAARRGVDVRLPTDVVIASEVGPEAPTTVVPADAIPDGQRGLDIGPASVASFADAMAGAATILWNGPMGVFEMASFAGGTEGVARAIAASGAFSVVGGGDSLLAVRRLGLEAAFGHLSTGGGASLEFLEGRDLPGIRALEVA